MSAVPTPTMLSVADLPSAVDEEFLSKVVDILERLRTQSEMRGHPLLAALLAITKGEAEDDLRTRASEFELGGFRSDDDAIVRMAQRLACGRRDEDEAPVPRRRREATAQLLDFIRA